MLGVILEIKNKNKNKIVLPGVPGVACHTGAHSIYLIAMKLSQVVGYMLAVVLEI